MRTEVNTTDTLTTAERPVTRPELIPDCVREDIGRAGLQAVLRYYQDPENERRFQEWLKRKKGDAK